MAKTDPYQLILNDIIEKIKASQYRAGIKVNAELLFVYWQIGKHILEQQSTEGWGAKIIDHLSRDIKIAFSGAQGFSVRNLKYMRLFADTYPQFGNAQIAGIAGAIVQVPPAQLRTKSKKTNVQAMLAQISWYHHTTLLDKVKDPDERFFYMAKAIENGWSRDVMVLQIEHQLYQRQGKAITNFSEVLGKKDSDLAHQTFKSPYVIDFIELTEEMKERDVEKAMVQHLKQLMLELGKGFAYVGNQYNLKVDGDEYFLDLLFYNTRLHCYVVFELKMGAFKPEYAGKLNFYINSIDAEIKTKPDGPTIGILLCKTPNKTVVKYALQGLNKPIGVAEYQLQDRLPAAMKKGLPTIEELEAELEKGFESKQKRSRK